MDLTKNLNTIKKIYKFFVKSCQVANAFGQVLFILIDKLKY